VNCTPLSGTMGQSVCPNGLEKFTSVMRVEDGTLTKDAVQLSTSELILPTIRTFAENNAINNFWTYLSMMENGVSEVGGRCTLGCAMSLPTQTVLAGAQSFSSPKQHTRYTAVIDGGNTGMPLVQPCLRAPIDPNRLVQWHDEVERDAGGCFAVDLTQAEERACLCRAHNLSGQWRRTDRDGCKYILDVVIRSRVGFTSSGPRRITWPFR